MCWQVENAHRRMRGPTRAQTRHPRTPFGETRHGFWRLGRGGKDGQEGINDERASSHEAKRNNGKAGRRMRRENQWEFPLKCIIAPRLEPKVRPQSETNCVWIRWSCCLRLRSLRWGRKSTVSGPEDHKTERACCVWAGRNRVEGQQLVKELL